MRPLRLELDGFSTFRERTELDFSGLDLLAFTGATGAGKSTLIDAITFALYGSVARYDNTARVAPVIHQLATQARVRLDFESGGRTYIATRVVRRRTSKSGDSQASTAEARLEVRDGDAESAETTVLAGDVKELNAAVEELLGLDFKQFTRTIVLPQGEFAAFLRDDPANRDKLLQRLLDLGVYERMGQLARAAAKKAANQIEVLAEQRRRHPPLGVEEFQAMTDRLEQVGQVRETVGQAVLQLTELDAELHPLRDRVTAIDQAVARLEATELPDELVGLDKQQRAAETHRVETEGRLTKARTVRDAARQELDDKPDRAELVRVGSQLEQLADARSNLAEYRATAAEVTARLTTLSAEQATIEDALGAAETTVRTARQAADAAGWTAALVKGEPCPVCHRTVEDIPDHDAAEEVDAAEAEHSRLRAEAKTIEKALAKAAGTEQAAADEIERQGERIDLLELQLSAYEGDAEPAAIGAMLEVVEAAELRLREATAAAADLESAVQVATEAERRLEQTMRTMRAGLASHRDSLADLEPPALGHESLIDDYDLLHRWAKDRASELGVERGELAVRGKQVANQRAELVDQIADATAAVAIQGPTEELPALLAEALTELTTLVAAAEQRRDDDRDLADQIDTLDADRVLHDALGRHLRAGGFSSWLLGEALDNIVAKATVWLLQLSNNQYSLVAGDRNFAIVDHTNADETRDVRTLSGGETFLASLALALALADSIAELAPVDSPRLESMFLDEGFGTLDPGTLDVVAGAIEELASTGRMIGIVTHVGDLADRMPARFEVTKGPAGSSVELIRT
ncbi:MAG: SMC family ATPase [Actinomycetota bacterium]